VPELPKATPATALLWNRRKIQLQDLRTLMIWLAEAAKVQITKSRDCRFEGHSRKRFASVTYKRPLWKRSFKPAMSEKPARRL